jgi:predicted amidophosphoribosyltransferase
MAGVSSLAQSLLDLGFPPRCARCGRPLLASRPQQRCDVCASGRGPAHLARLRAASVYEGAIRAAILAYKFRGVRRRAEPLGELLAEASKREGPAVDLVTHVPLHAACRGQRGYDQSQLLARESARRLSLPFLPDTAKRVRATEPQTHLQGDERITNVAGALALANASVVERRKDRHILLIDDVTATGSTLDTTAAAPTEARPAAIYGLALSRPDGESIS